MPIVSIIVTSYNIEAYIEDCLTSITGQTLRDIEIIVVDDGSSDATPEIIGRFASSDDRIVPVLLGTNSPGGVATAANAGLDLATGDFVGFADGDDVYFPTMFERLLNAALAHDAELSMCRYGVLDDQTKAVSEPADAGRWDTIDRPVYALDSVDEHQRFLRFIAVPWRKLYRRSLLDEHHIRFPVGDYFYEDNPFHWFSILSARSIAVVPHVLCHHRVARAGQTMASADARLFKIFEHHDTIRTWLVARDLTTDFGATLLGWAISQMEWIAPRTPVNLRAELFAILRRVFAQYDADTVGRALAQGNKGQRARQLSAAIGAGDLRAFERALGQRTTTTNPVVSGAYHLRHSGVAETARITRRYVAMRIAGLPLVRIGRRSRTEIGNDDLMLSLMVIERRLALLEDAVTHLAAQVARED